MRNLNLIKTAAIFFVALFFQVLSANGANAASCSLLTGTVATDPLFVPSLVNGDRACTVTPTFLRIKFYEAGICRSTTINNTQTAIDMSTCAVLYANTNGKTGNISGQSVMSLDGDISVDEGVYTHSYILIDTAWNFRLAHEFPSNRSAQDASGTRTTTGVHCYTKEVVLGDGNVDCGDTSELLFTTEDTKIIGMNSPHNYYASTMSLSGGPAVSTQSMILNADRTIPTGDISGTPPALTNGHQRKYFYVEQELLNNINISANTSGIDVEFLVTDAGQILFEDVNNATCAGCIKRMTMTAPTFNWSSN